MTNRRLRTGKQGSSFPVRRRSEEHTSELQSLRHLVCRLLLEKKKESERRADEAQCRRARVDGGHRPRDQPSHAPVPPVRCGSAAGGQPWSSRLNRATTVQGEQ